jgi:hypothetical protein
MVKIVTIDLANPVFGKPALLRERVPRGVNGDQLKSRILK